MLKDRKFTLIPNVGNCKEAIAQMSKAINKNYFDSEIVLATFKLIGNLSLS